MITVVDEKLTLGGFAEVAEVSGDIERLLDGCPAEAFPLLRRTLRTVFATQSIGLERVAPDSDWRCYIPLTERTADAVSLPVHGVPARGWNAACTAPTIIAGWSG